MSDRIEDVGSEEFARLFTSFRHTAYRLETLQRYDVSYEEEPYRAFLAGEPQPEDPAKNDWTAMIRAAVGDGKVLQRVHLVTEPLTDYLRYEFEWSYEPNVEAGEDIRVLPTAEWPREAPQDDYWLFDSRDLWVMHYGDGGIFQYAELINDVDAGWMVSEAGYWRDAALHKAVPYRDYMRRALLRQAS